MNIINIVNGTIEKNIEDTITCNNNYNNIVINVKNDNSLCINIQNQNIKNKLEINIEKNSNVKIFLMTNIEDNFSAKINIQKDSKLLLNRFTNSKNLIENFDINLNGTQSNIEYYHSCLGNIKEALNIYHNESSTNSNVNTHAVSNNTNMEFNIIEKVPNKKVNCKLSQKSKIINLKDNKSTIRPILLVDEKETSAFHSSTISPINKSDLLYLMSRGISEEESVKLLTNGFLINNLKIDKEEKHLLFEKYIFRR